MAGFCRLLEVPKGVHRASVNGVTASLLSSATWATVPAARAMSSTSDRI